MGVDQGHLAVPGRDAKHGTERPVQPRSTVRLGRQAGIEGGFGDPGRMFEDSTESRDKVTARQRARIEAFGHVAPPCCACQWRAMSRRRVIQTASCPAA